MNPLCNPILFFLNVKVCRPLSCQRQTTWEVSHSYGPITIEYDKNMSALSQWQFARTHDRDCSARDEGPQSKVV